MAPRLRQHAACAQYFVTWDPGLIFPGPNQAPMDYQSADPLLIASDKVGRFDLTDSAPACVHIGTSSRSPTGVLTSATHSR